MESKIESANAVNIHNLVIKKVHLTEVHHHQILTDFLISHPTIFIVYLMKFLLRVLILLQFNKFTIILGMGSMILAFSYPFMKRVTYWPQLFLGLTFNWGIIMAWAAIHNNITVEISILYLSAIFWTLGYDTIYGAQDISDDEIIGVKSTSVKFKKNMKLFVILSYFLTALIIAYLFLDNIKLDLSTFFISLFYANLIYQIFKFKIKVFLDNLVLYSLKL